MKNVRIDNHRAPAKTNAKNRTGLYLKSEIVFGSLSTGCKGSGVCKVLPTGLSDIVWKCPRAMGYISIVEPGRLRIEFIKSSMTQAEIRRYFRWGLFQVFEPYAMPRFVRRHLKVNDSLIILPGIYTVTETADELIVDF